MKLFFLMILLISCTQVPSDRNSVKLPEVVDDKYEKLTLVLKRVGFSSEYRDSKCIGYETEENTIQGVKRQLVVDFIRGLNITVKLDEIFNIDNGFYPKYYKLEDDILTLEFIQVGEPANYFDNGYVYRTSCIDLKNNTADYYDLFSSNDRDKMRISKQNKNRVISYNLSRQELKDEASDVFIYVKEKYDIETKSKNFLSKDTISADVDLNVFCEGGL